LIRCDSEFTFARTYARVPPATAFSRGFLNTAIPEGRETNALLTWGHRRWRDLYTSRQIAAFEAVLSKISALQINNDVRQRLLLAVCGLAEMPGYACRWDPKYRKTYEIGSNHHYSRVVLAAEINPIGRYGRGTLARRLKSAVTAAHWHPGSKLAHVKCGSSCRQPIKNSTIDLVITDPPYYDSVQYAELSRLFRVFMRAIGTTFSDQAEHNEAVPNAILRCTHDQYIKRLVAVFKETARTLRPRGRMLLTFHHRRLIAWCALAKVLKMSGWRIVSLAVVHSENEKDFAKNKKNAITSDLVIECVKKQQARRCRVKVCRVASDKWSQNLVAIGLSLAGVINGSDSDLRERFVIEAQERRLTRLLID
jgi:adenine-specific DNA methylase